MTVGRRLFMKDHPRVCGEKRPLLKLIESIMGSPPRVRGKEMKQVSALVNDGITPACAGKSGSCRL